MWERSAVAAAFYRTLLALGGALGRVGVTPNTVTYASLFFATLAAGLIAIGWFATAAACVAAGGACDALDGIVARTTNAATRFGALLDSTVDRVTDALPLLGLLVFYGAEPLLALIPALALVGTVVIPYTRARAEALGVQLPTLFMRRPERLVLLVVCLLLGTLPVAAPVAAPLLLIGVLVLALLSLLGAFLVLRAAHHALSRQTALGARETRLEPDVTLRSR